MSTVVDRDVLACWREDLREKAAARPHPCACGKARPQVVRLPSEMQCGVREVPWWKIAEPLVWVRIPDGAVLCWRLWSWEVA